MSPPRNAKATVRGILCHVTNMKDGKEPCAEIDTGGEGVANEQNLVPFTSEQSREEAVKNGKKGGIASGEARRARKSLRAELEVLLSEAVIDKKTGKPTDSTVQQAITVALVQKALRGNTKAYEIIRDTIGEKPVERFSLEEISQDTIDEVEKMVRGDDPR